MEKRIDKQLNKMYDNELKYLLSVLQFLPFNDNRRSRVYDKISQIKRIQKLDQPTQINISSNAESPLAQFLKNNNNEKITKKEPRQSRFTR